MQRDSKIPIMPPFNLSTYAVRDGYFCFIGQVGDRVWVPVVVIAPNAGYLPVSGDYYVNIRFFHTIQLTYSYYF